MTRGTPFGKTASPFNDINRHSPTKAPKSDPLKLNKLEPPRNSYEYKEYKPTHVGMYGEKQTEKRKPAAKPSGKPSPRTVKPPEPKVAKQTKATGRKIKTFKFYEMDIGPDIKVGKTGPDIPVKEYKYQDPDRLHKPYVEKPFREPKNPKSGFETKKIDFPKKHEDYKLTEQNNLGMRHWHYGYVDDTIMRRDNDHVTRSELVPKTPQGKPVAAVKPTKNKENKKPQTPVTAEYVKPIVAPVPVPVQKKKFKDSSTQHVPPKNKTSETQTKAAPVKTFGTQYEKASPRHMNVQTDAPNPLPPIAAAGAVMAAPPTLNKVKSKSVQATEPEKKVVATGTQYTGPTTRQATMQTSPVAFAAPVAPVTEASKVRRTPSPEVAYTETLQTREWSPEQVYRAPSPEAVQQYETIRRSPPPVVPVVVPVRNNTPPRRQYTPPRTNSPRQASPPRQTPPRQSSPRQTPPRRESTPPRRDSLYRVTPPNRLETPPRVQTPPRVDSPPRWQSPTNSRAQTPERTASPPRTFAPVVVPVTSTQNPPPYQARQSPVRVSPDNYMYRSPPPEVPVYQQPQARDANVYDQPGNQTYARAPYQPTSISPTRSPLQDPIVSSKPPSPERASPIFPRNTNYPSPPQTLRSPPPVQHPYFTPRREEPSPERYSPPHGNVFQGYQPADRRMRLPPEVNACIEAYDNVRSEPVRRSGESLPSVRRTMQLA